MNNGLEWNQTEYDFISFNIEREEAHFQEKTDKIWGPGHFTRILNIRINLCEHFPFKCRETLWGKFRKAKTNMYADNSILLPTHPPKQTKL